MIAMTGECVSLDILYMRIELFIAFFRLPLMKFLLNYPVINHLILYLL